MTEEAIEKEMVAGKKNLTPRREDAKKTREAPSFLGRKFLAPPVLSVFCKSPICRN
jgi:hypothetical protein